MGAVEQKIRKDIFRHVEAELYAYPYRKREIERIRLEIMSDSKEPFVVGGKNSVRQPGDPTGKVAIKLASSARLMYLERVTDAIEQVYNSLPEPKQELICVKYWTHPQRLTTLGICEKIGISERTYQRWRNQIVWEIAEILGWS